MNRYKVFMIFLAKKFKKDLKTTMTTGISGEINMGHCKSNFHFDKNEMKKTLFGSLLGFLLILVFNSHIIALSLIHISEPTRLGMISYAVFCLKKKKK